MGEGKEVHDLYRRQFAWRAGFRARHPARQSGGLACPRSTRGRNQRRRFSSAWPSNGVGTQRSSALGVFPGCAAAIAVGKGVGNLPKPRQARQAEERKDNCTTKRRSGNGSSLNEQKDPEILKASQIQVEAIERRLRITAI